MNNVGLVLEGGGMRGVYTCGVLEFFLDNELYFNYTIGVSAGACNAATYISRQKGRNEKVTIHFSNDKRYMGIRNLIREKSYFGMNFIFNEIPNSLVPFDLETFKKSDCKFLIGVTDCNTGKPLYLNKEDVDNTYDALRATASLPLISPIVNFKGYKLLDGGISDPIPIRKSIEDGNEKNIIVLTRHKEYRKTPNNIGKLLKLKYNNYPHLIKAIENRYKYYNDTLDFIEKLEKDGKAIVIRPTAKLEIDRFEKSSEKLHKVYKEGYRDVESHYNKIIEFAKS